MKGAVVWITGLPSSGKSTFADRASASLRERGIASCILDGDVVRGALTPQPGYGESAREGFYLTLGGLAAMLAEQGLVVLVAATAHRRAYREQARARTPRFFEVLVSTPAEECARRDAKGLYRAAERGELTGLPGRDAPYEAPAAPLVVAGGGHDEDAIGELIEALEQP